jgi:aryl-alcohol dehydrogenase-like predicted oxidoreductase
MKYRKLGKSELMISEIGLGCMSIPSYDEKKGISIIHRALDLGINYFDTADLYDRGANESVLGSAIKWKRDQVILATKVGNQWKEGESGWQWNPTKEYILKAVDESLKRLQTDYIDLYQLHGGTIEDPIDETIGAFEYLKAVGKIRYYGISSIRPNVIREYVRRSEITSVLMQYSLADRRPEEEVLNLLHENNIGVLARGSLAQGMLVNKEAKEYLGHPAGEIAYAAGVIKKICKGNEAGAMSKQDVKEKHTAAQTAIRYVLQHPALTSAIVGVSRLEQLEEIAGTSDGEQLTEQELWLLASSIPALRYEQHR